MRRVVATLVTGLLVGGLAGCGATAQRPGAGEVVVSRVEVFRGQHADLAAYVNAVPTIVMGEVAAADDRAYEVPVDAAGEGNIEGEGPEIYGTVAFRITKVIKGGLQPGDTLTLVFLSGKWNDADKRGLRIAYQHDELRFVQTTRATLRTPADLRGTSFIVFARPKPEQVPVTAAGLHIGTPALAGADGTIRFPGDTPFRTPIVTTVGDITALV